MNFLNTQKRFEKSMKEDFEINNFVKVDITKFNFHRLDRFKQVDIRLSSWKTTRFIFVILYFINSIDKLCFQL
jgi:hypothetical protein